MADTQQYTCKRCGKTMRAAQFYTRWDKSKSSLCKKCLGAHIDALDKETYLWIMEDMDVPYIPSEWEASLQKYHDKHPNDEVPNGGTVLGYYLAKMKLSQHKDERWADTAKILEEYERRMAAEEAQRAAYIAETKRQYEEGEISEAQYNTLTSISEQYEEHKNNLASSSTSDLVGEKNNPFMEANFFSPDEMPDIGGDLDKEEKLRLAVRWGRLYRPDQWVFLERLYLDFKEAFGVYDPARLDTLKKICKTSLKMDEAIDVGDIDGFGKLSRTYDALMRAGKFTEAQKREQQAGDFDAVGQIVQFAESKKGGGKIERYQITKPHDHFDEAIDKMNNYYTTLINNDPTIKQQIENYIKKHEIAKEMEQDGADYRITDEDLQKSREQGMINKLKDEGDIEALNSYLKSIGREEEIDET